ncbi:MAG: 2-hydroxyacyl-CoA dehydratase [Sandaracinaceae bacterium]|nr:2-hydroxyacyl-CoA dehydratase [Sandaracinaceae bacterium]
MSRLSEIVERAEALYHDVDYGEVARWKERHGGKAIGHMPIYAPREIVDAAGMLAVGVHGGGDRVEIIRGDAYFQSYICQIPRSTIELALGGKLDVLDGMLFPAICDVIRNLSGMWQVLFPERYVRYLDVPQDFDPAVGGRFYAEELDTLRRDLGELGGRDVTEEDVRVSIGRYNANRAAIEDLMQLRAEAPWLAPAWESYLVIRAGDVLRAGGAHRARPRVHRAGAERRPAHARLHAGARHRRLLRAAAARADPDAGARGLLRRVGRSDARRALIRGDVDTSGDPIAALARAYVERSTDNALRLRCEERQGRGALRPRAAHPRRGRGLRRAELLRSGAARSADADGRARSRGDPWTAFKYAENLGQFQVIREQAGTFADSIRLWSDA